MRLALPHRFRAPVAFAHDTAMAAICFVLALYLRLGEEQFHLAEPYLLPGMALFTACCLGSFLALKLYRGLWRYASLPDLVALTRAVSVGVALFTVLMFALYRLEGMPRSLPVILWLLLLAMLGAPRFLYRAVKDRTLSFHFTHDARKQVPLLLVGVTPSAEQFIRDTRRNPDSPYRVVGLLDENQGRHGREVQGIRVYGALADTPRVVEVLARKGVKPQRLILTTADNDGKASRTLLEAATPLGIGVGRLHGELKVGLEEKPDIRPIAIEDLLGRAQNLHDRDAMRALVAGRCVAITGAGGSIGSELARQVASFAPAEIILLEQGEYALYSIDRELSEHFSAVPRHAYLADVRDAGRLDAIFSQHKPQLVFHAAAIKHVPLAEANPQEAIHTNVFGTKNVADACRTHNVATMVLISTDKAVNPTNVMGATKRLAESYCQALGQAGSGTRFFTVRFGNVLGSTGSVVPLFQSQLAKGGPLTLTHKDMVRYFMTIREAVELVLQAAALGQTLEQRHEAIFVLDMGTPMRITDLAEQMVRLAGLKPGEDVQLTYTGLRPGEKLFEELFYDAESVTRTEKQGILLASAREMALDSLQNSLAPLLASCRERTPEPALSTLRTLVPEYQPA